MDNFLLMTDSYKVSHHKMMNPDITREYAYLEARGGPFDVVFYGLQGILQEYFEGTLFSYADILEAQAFWEDHFGRDDVFDIVAWTRLYEKYEGRLPIRIHALEEGTIVKPRTVLLTIENTDDEFPWLPMAIEPVLLKIWAPIAVASQSHFLRQQIRSIGLDTSDNIDAIINFMVHDFGYRGVSSEETARILGAAHLTSFDGTDNVQGIRYIQQHYQDSNLTSTMYGYSIPASEHSIILGYDSEVVAFEAVLDAFPEGLVACVSDTNNIYDAVDHLWGEQLHDKIAQRKGRLVVRPDSGNALDVVPIVLNKLAEKFGYSVNSRGYDVLPDFVRVIQGDGMNVETIPALYRKIVREGFAPDNLVIGSGGGLLQQLTRDTQEMAIKPSELTLKNGTTRSVSKNPITATNKHSKRGRFAVVQSGDEFQTVAWSQHLPNLLTLVYENGMITRETTFEAIRAKVR